MSMWTTVFFTVGVVALVVAWLVVDSADHGVREEYAVAVLGFVVPLTALTFVVIAVRERRADRSFAA